MSSAINSQHIPPNAPKCLRIALAGQWIQHQPPFRSFATHQISRSIFRQSARIIDRPRRTHAIRLQSQQRSPSGASTNRFPLHHGQITPRGMGSGASTCSDRTSLSNSSRWDRIRAITDSATEPSGASNISRPLRSIDSITPRARSSRKTDSAGLIRSPHGSGQHPWK
jgi:hypothetical protein